MVRPLQKEKGRNDPDCAGAGRGRHEHPHFAIDYAFLKTAGTRLRRGDGVAVRVTQS